MKQGRLIAIEGIDGVGKNTQAKLLRDHIAIMKGECGFFSFPRYETPTGALVGEYLKSGRNDLTLEQRAGLYADDRLAARDEMLSYLNRGVDVVCDRYITSNLAYFSQFEKMDRPNAEPTIVNHILNQEFNINKIPHIDLLIVLSLPIAVSDALMQKKAEREYTSEKLDLHEANRKLQLACQEYYNSYEEAVLYCNDGDESIMPIEDIHKEVVTRYEVLNLM